MNMHKCKFMVFTCVAFIDSCEITNIMGHTKDHQKNGTNCLPAWHTMH